MIKTVGHQTIENTGEQIATRLRLGPVKSTIFHKDGTKKKKPPFAGDGFYFWDDSIEAADWWGTVHYVNYGKSYRVFRINLELRYDDNSFFDLIGSRQHLKLLGQLIKKVRMSIPCEDWTLEQFITYFRLQEGRKKGLFPYKMVRFNDYSLNPKIHDYIALSNEKHKTLMNPFYIICVFEEKDLNLSSYIFIK